jgi:hypothetical protein
VARLVLRQSHAMQRCVSHSSRRGPRLLPPRVQARVPRRARQRPLLQRLLVWATRPAAAPRALPRLPLLLHVCLRHLLRLGEGLWRGGSTTHRVP